MGAADKNNFHTTRLLARPIPRSLMIKNLISNFGKSILSDTERSWQPILSRIEEQKFTDGSTKAKSFKFQHWFRTRKMIYLF